MPFKIDAEQEEMIVGYFGMSVMSELRGQLMEIWIMLTSEGEYPIRKFPHHGISISLHPVTHQWRNEDRYQMTGDVYVNIAIHRRYEWGERNLPETTVCFFSAESLALAKRRNMIHCLASWDQQTIID